MSDYNKFVTAINKVFDYLNKMKAGWNDQDNLNYIESIEEYKSIVVANANIFKTPQNQNNNKSTSLEVLGNDW